MTREARRHNFAGMWVRNGTWGALEIHHKFHRRASPRVFVGHKDGAGGGSMGWKRAFGNLWSFDRECARDSSKSDARILKAAIVERVVN